MTRFEEFIAVIFRNEGYGTITNDKSDSGGLTRWGISKNNHPNVDVANLTKEQAQQIYKHDYYDVCKIDSISNELLALHVFDMAVNAGVSKAIKTLQTVAHVGVDGVIGYKTLSAVNSQQCVTKYIQARKDYYTKIGVGKNAKYLKGWMNRIENTTKSLL